MLRFVAAIVFAGVLLVPRSARAQDPSAAADPLVVAQAAALQNDPNNIFTYVRDQIRFEPYRGSVRGARGTLWSRAGNTLDRASLLVALLGAAGYQAQYEHALSPNTPAMIRHMFDGTTQFIGCIPSSVSRDDPGFNGDLQSDSSDYYWVRYSGIDLDPNQPGAQPGQTFATPDQSFAVVPQNLRQQVTFRVVAELYNQANALFGLGPGQTTVLTQTYDASALVGTTVSVGNLVSASGGGGLSISATTFTYTPYLLLGSLGSDVKQDPIVVGTSYQELYTNFPLGSTILTGLFLEVDAVDSTYTPRTYRRTLLDRIGPAARQGLTGVNLTLPSPPAPAVTNYDVATVNVLTSRQSLDVFQAQQTRLTTAYQNYLAIKPLLDSIPTTGTLTAAQDAIVQQALTLAQYLLIAENELLTMSYNGAADELAGQLNRGYYVRIYPISPRLTIAQSSTTAGAPSFALDVLKNDMRVVGGITQSRNAPYYAEVARGFLESLLEGQVLTSVTGQPASGIGEVLAALPNPKPLTVFAPTMLGYASSTLPGLDATQLSPDAKALITDAVSRGLTVLAPTQMVTLQGRTTVGWFETDQSGHTISHFDTGGHQAIVGYASALVNTQKWNEQVATFIGQVEGFGVTGIAFAGAVLSAVASQTASAFPGQLTNVKNTFAGVGNAISFGAEAFEQLKQDLELARGDLAERVGVSEAFLEAPPNQFDPGGVLLAYAKGLADGFEQAQGWIERNLPYDPTILTFLGSPLGPALPSVSPGAVPGVQVAISPDPFFTSSINALSAPLVYQALITNIGPATDTFNIGVANGSSGFFIRPNVSSLTLGPGQVGLVNVCVDPNDPLGINLPAPGTTQPFGLTASSVSNGAVSSTMNTSFLTPSIPTLQMSSDPPQLVVSPGGSTQATLTFGGEGNAAPGSVAVAAVPPAGLSVNGLTSPVTVPLNGVVTESISVSAAASATMGTYTVPITASYNAAGSLQRVGMRLSVAVVSIGQCAIQASSAASQIEKRALAFTLNDVAADMTGLAGDPSNVLLANRLVSDMTFLIAQNLDATFLQAQAAPLTAATNAVAQANAATMPAALGTLNSALCGLSGVLTQANNYGGQMWVFPSSQVAGPQQAVTYTIELWNFSPFLREYGFSVSGVPNEVAAQFNHPSVSLGPNGSGSNFSNSVTLTLTPGPSFTTPFTFNVIATPVGAPEFARTAPASLFVRPETVNVDNVTVTPPFVNPGTPVTVSARVFAAVNQSRPATLALQVSDVHGNAVISGISNDVTLTTNSSLQTITFSPLNTTNLSPGPYVVSAQVFDSLNTNQSTPGPSATAAMFVGSPLSATLTANPTTVPPGASTVHATLTIGRDTVQNPISTLVGVASVSGTPRSVVLYPNGNQLLAYVCSDSTINTVDVTDQANPALLGSFGGNLLTANGASGFVSVTCGISGSTLVVSYSRENGNATAAIIPTHFAAFSLANPTQPVQVGSVVDIARPDSSGFVPAGSSALLFQNDVLYNPFSKFIFAQHGDVWSIDLSNVASGSVAFQNDLYPCGSIDPSTNQCTNTTDGIPNDPNRGGPHSIRDGVAVNAATAYYPSSSSSGGNTLRPANPPINGQLLVVDTSNPSSLSVITKVDAPASAYLTSVAIQGNIAVAVGDSTGLYDALSGLVGTVVIASFDISNPTSPVLLSQVVTQLKSPAGATIVALGSNTFAVGGTTNNGNPVLALVDATTPNALRFVPYDAPFVASPRIAAGTLFYSLSSTSLAIFQLGAIAGPELSISLEVPNGGGAAAVPGTFSLAPSSVTPGVGFDTYVWDQPSVDTIGFDVAVSGMNPGDVRTIVIGGRLDYTLPTLGTGSFNLPSLDVLSTQIMTIAPEQRATRAGTPVTYDVTVANPLNAPQTFDLRVFGVPDSWISLPSNVSVAARGSQTVTMTMTPPLDAPFVGFGINGGANYTFTITATSAGVYAAVGGRLIVNDQPALGGNQNNFIFNFVASATPSQITVGRGDSGHFSITATNVGNTVDANSYVFFNQPADMPPGWFLTFFPVGNLFLPAGLNASRSVDVQVFVPAGALPGSYTVHVPVSHFGSSTVLVPVTIVVSTSGIQGFFTPNAGPPQTNFVLTLTNTGQIPDVFDLSVAGTLSQAAAPAVGAVTLAAGASTNVAVTLNAIDYLIPANAQLLVMAVSEIDPAVRGFFTATVTVPGTRGLSASIDPTPTNVALVPGSTTLLVKAINTGNVADSYSASIVNINGPLVASLIDLSGQPAQTVPQFFLEPLATGTLPMHVTLSSVGSGTVTVQITSLTDGQVTATAVATINGPGLSSPVANAGTGGVVPLHRLTLLDGSASYDVNVPPLPLAYAWTLQSAPNGSALTSQSIHFAGGVEAAFVPDVAGMFVFKLTVTSTAGSGSATVSYDAQIVAPVADAGKPQFAKTGTFVFLNGAASFDPNGLPLTLAWSLPAVPNSSLVTDADLHNGLTPKPFFTCDIAGPYTAQLVVDNGTLSSPPATTLITCVDGNVPPNANAGPARNVALGAGATLDGSNSSDPDNGPQALSYAWTLKTIPQGSTASNADILNAATAHPTFAPDAAGDFVFTLTVSDGLASSHDDVAVHVFARNTPPMADAGPPQLAVPAQFVSMNGSQSVDPDNSPQPLAFAWSFESRPEASAASLVTPNTATPHFTPDQPGYYVARLQVDDGLGAGFANTIVTVAAICDADANGVLNQLDVDLVAAAVGQSAPAHDARDANGDGTIDSRDVAACQAIVSPPQTGAIAIAKHTVGGDGVFAFSSSFGVSSIATTNGSGAQTVSSLSPGSSYSISEMAQPGWDLTGTPSCDRGTIAAIQVVAGQTTTCTFTNTRRGHARVVKTVGNAPPSGNQAFAFQLRSGASVSAAGTVLESLVASASNAGTISFATDLVPGVTYQMCEIVLPGWLSSLGPPQYSVFNPSGDNSAICTDFTAGAGTTSTFAVVNTFPGGLARGIGFWKNWASCSDSRGNQTFVLDQTLAAFPINSYYVVPNPPPTQSTHGIYIGSLYVDTCSEAVSLLNKSTTTAKKMASDPAFGLAAQLMAAVLNVRAGAAICNNYLSAVQLAQTLLWNHGFDGTTHRAFNKAELSEAVSLERLLEDYNMDHACPANPPAPLPR